MARQIANTAPIAGSATSGPATAPHAGATNAGEAPPVEVSTQRQSAHASLHAAPLVSIDKQDKQGNRKAISDKLTRDVAAYRIFQATL